MSAPTQIWLVIEESESGTFADGTTYAVLAAEATEAGAPAAVAAWRMSHAGIDDEPHAYEDADGWCSCGAGVVVRPIEVSQ